MTPRWSFTHFAWLCVGIGVVMAVAWPLYVTANERRVLAEAGPAALRLSEGSIDGPGIPGGRWQLEQAAAIRRIRDAKALSPWTGVLVGAGLAGFGILILAIRSPRAKTTVATILFAMLLTGCQLYWTKPGATLATFSADHQTCATKAGVPMEGERLLVNESMYKACLKGLGWGRETGGTYGNSPGYYRGLEDDAVMKIGEIPAQVGATERQEPGDRYTGDATATQLVPGRLPTPTEIRCREVWLTRMNWRDNLPQYRACIQR